MEFNASHADKEHVLMGYINNEMPRYQTSKERMHTMFIRKCISPVSSYQTCIGNNKWYYYIIMF